MDDRHRRHVLNGRNRRTGTPEHPLAGGLFRCEYCGQSITGERIRRKLKGGGVREHLYYRCANNRPGAEHPQVRWKAEELEAAIVDDLSQLRIPSPEIATWFRTALQATVLDLTSTQRRQASALTKRQSELTAMQNRLLNAYLAGTVDAETYKAKCTELKLEAAKTGDTLAQVGNLGARGGDTALALFDWSQRAGDLWRGSNNALRREIRDAVCLNRTLSDVSLVTKKRQPFDVFAEGLENENRRGDGTAIELFIAGVRDWEAGIRRRIEDSEPE